MCVYIYVCIYIYTGSETEHLFGILRDNTWIGPYSRALFIDYLIYSPVRHYA